MQSNFVVRLIDLTLLLLLSLLAVVRINEYEVALPVSHDLLDTGTLPLPIKASVSVSGDVFIEGLGQVTAGQLAQVSAQQGRAVEIRVDGDADVSHLLHIHKTLDAASRPAVFMVEHQSR